MSVVACKIYKDRYEIASDSIAVWGWSQTKGKEIDLVKLIEDNGLIIGYSGPSSEMEMMRIFVKSHKPSEENPEAILDFMDEFVNWMKKKTDNDHSSIKGAFIIGMSAKVFQFNCWNVGRVLTYSAIGAGMDYANTALYLGHDVEKAVEVATELSIYCEKPIIKKVKKF